jgi:hypothetical protein
MEEAMHPHVIEAPVIIHKEACVCVSRPKRLPESTVQYVEALSILPH